MATIYAHELTANSITILDADRGPSYEFYIPDLDDLRNLRVSVVAHSLGGLVAKLLKEQEVLELTTAFNALTFHSPRITLTGKARSIFEKLLCTENANPGVMQLARTQVIVGSAASGQIGADTVVEEVTAMQDYPIREFFDPKSADFIRWLNADGVACTIDVSDRDNVHLEPEVFPPQSDSDPYFISRVQKSDGYLCDALGEEIINGRLDENGVFVPT